MSTSLVTIVLSTYNGERYIRESIDSCLSQTYGNFELIVVNDGSTDRTSEILAGYSDPRIRVIQHETNKKLPAALNTGFRASRGEYLTLTSDDNRYAPNALSVLVEALQSRPQVGLVYSGYRLIDEHGNFIRNVLAEPPELLNRKCVVGASFLFRRQVYQVIGDFNEELFGIEDYEYWLRIAQRFRIEAIDDILYDYRVHPASLTSRDTLAQRAQALDRVQTIFFGADPNRFKRYLGELYMARAFEDYLRGQFSSVPMLVLRALVRKPDFVSNRGVWSIFFRSLLKRVRFAM